MLCCAVLYEVLVQVHTSIHHDSTRASSCRLAFPVHWHQDAGTTSCSTQSCLPGSACSPCTSTCPCMCEVGPTLVPHQLARLSIAALSPSLSQINLHLPPKASDSSVSTTKPAHQHPLSSPFDRPFSSVRASIADPWRRLRSRRTATCLSRSNKVSKKAQGHGRVGTLNAPLLSKPPASTDARLLPAPTNLARSNLLRQPSTIVFGSFSLAPALIQADDCFLL